MWRLAILLGLQAGQRACWFVPLLFYMEKVAGFTGVQISMVIGTGSLASMLAPYVAGWLADRFLPGQRLYLLLHLMGAGALFCAWLTPSFWWLLGLVLFENLCFMGGVTLINAICFRLLKNPSGFGWLTIGGTVGWMLVSWGFSVVLDIGGDAALRGGLLAGAVMHLAIALFAWSSLPEAPPASRGERALDWQHMRRLLGQPGLTSLLLAAAACGFAYAFVHPYTQFRFTDAGMGEGATQRGLTLGQLCEIIALLVLAALHKTIGMKRVLLLGMAALLLRMGVMSLDPPLWLLVSVQGLHGVDFAFAAVTIAIVAESLSSPETRARAQALSMLCLWGLGRFVGFFASGWAWDAYDGPDKWTFFFELPAIVVVSAMVIFAVNFPKR